MTTGTAAVPEAGSPAAGLPGFDPTAGDDQQSPAERPSHWLRMLLGYVRPHRVTFGAAAVLLLASSGLGLLQPLAAKALIDRLTENSPIGPTLTALTLLVVTAAVMLGIGNYLMLRTAEAVVLDGRRGLVRHLFRLSVGSMRSQAPGDLLARVTTDTMLLRQIASQSLIDVLTGGLMLVGAVVLMAIVDLVLLGVTVVVVLVLVVLLSMIMPRIRTAALRAQESVGEMGAALERVLGAFTTVKASGTEVAEMERVDVASRTAYHQGISLARWGSVAGTTAGLAIQVAFLVVLGVGGARVASGAMTVSALVGFLLYVAYLTHPLIQLVSASTYLQAGRAALSRIAEVNALPAEPLDLPATPTAPVAVRRSTHGLGPASVIFDRIWFTYPGRAEPAVADFTLTVPAGGLTALVGPSGSGKTTVLSLLERFYDPQRGHLRLDGRDLRNWDLNELRASIGYVEQDVAVLAGTLRENVAYATPGASEAEIRDVLRTTRLLPLLDRLGGDLDAEIKHRGVSLSGGERQRIAIARALLRKPRLLLLDEATSQLDAANEAALRDVIQEIAHHTTVVVVAHRLSTVLEATQIVVMQDGAARSIGRHSTLVRTDPLYAELAKEQALV
ncbi:ABC transporter ATP-binding protein [Micromonospora polyrhachis]|uniref:ABC-type multidrug transport system fused ATPase/permease subunit n=1 Tax=Micromonospora polyrhachis TaxID=1282883 RepID=A0A7W7SWB8_9ACTN|nr:ABC transporter ATP-binding protein [Micromonospora polyrhachis]MBB4962182.1 ABC-type multidrug transport system fused ATPase/permease subunit [Micromonospora polyrhachis]